METTIKIKKEEYLKVIGYIKLNETIKLKSKTELEDSIILNISCDRLEEFEHFEKFMFEKYDKPTKNKSWLKRLFRFI